LKLKKLATASVVAAALVLAACATTPSKSGPSTDGTAPAASIGTRDLTAQEKTAIIDAIAPSLRNPGAAKYRWAKIPAVVTEESVNYCATVDALSPFAAYSGHQAYIVEAKVQGGRVTSAVLGLIAGGKDFSLVTQMCAKYGLDPNNAS
jgi:hypothetical protein